MPVRFKDEMWRVEMDALRLLAAAKICDAHIVRTDSQVILFTQAGAAPKDKNEQPVQVAWTAWLSDDRKTILRLDRGFTANY